MSLKEWKNNELNQLLLKKFGILNEKLGDGKTQPTDSVEAGLDNNKEFTRSDLAAEKGGARGDGKKKADEEGIHGRVPSEAACERRLVASRSSPSTTNLQPTNCGC